MAGSYHHVTDDAGRLLSPRAIQGTLDTPGDVYEAIEEMYAMIWNLAEQLSRRGLPVPPVVHVENARQIYIEVGLRAAPGYAADHEV